MKHINKGRINHSYRQLQRFAERTCNHKVRVDFFGTIEQAKQVLRDSYVRSTTVAIVRINDMNAHVQMHCEGVITIEPIPAPEFPIKDRPSTVMPSSVADNIDSMIKSY